MTKISDTTPLPPHSEETQPGFEGWQFENCELRLLPQTKLRELRVNGRARALPARGFELLLLLIRERHRVVGHQELAERLGITSDSPPSTLPGTVSMLRTAIDTEHRQRGHEASAIRTVHRMGYRFVAPVRALAAPVSAALADVPGLPRLAPVPPGVAAHTDGLPARLRLGILRCVNRTGLQTLQWTEAGLMALVGHALARDPRLQVVDAETFLRPPLADETEGQSTASIHRLMQGLGLNVLVRCSLWLDGTHYRLEHQTFVSEQPYQHASVSEPSPLALGEGLAQAVQALLFGDHARRVALESSDEFVNLVFAQAVELFAQGQYLSAADLMSAVCRLQPSSLAAELWRLRAWSNAGDARAVAAGEELLAKARACRNDQILAMTHAAMGTLACVSGTGMAQAAGKTREHRSVALSLLGSHRREAWALRLRLWDAVDAYERGDVELARRLLRVLRADARAVNCAHMEVVARLNLATAGVGSRR